MLIRSVDTIYIKLCLGIEIHVKPGVPNIRPRGQKKPDKDSRVAHLITLEYIKEVYKI